MQYQKFLVSLLVVLCAQNVVCGWNQMVEDFFYSNTGTALVNAGVQTYKFGTAIVESEPVKKMGEAAHFVGIAGDALLHTKGGEYVTKLLKEGYGHAETFLAPHIIAAKNFIDETIKTIDKYVDVFTDVAVVLAEKIGQKAMEVFNKAKDELTTILKKGMEMFCNLPAPEWLTTIIKAKDKICDNPIDLMGIKDEILAELYRYKEEADRSTLEFAQKFQDKVELAAKTLEKNNINLPLINDDLKSKYKSLVTELYSFSADLKVATIDDTDKILEDADDIADDSLYLFISLVKIEDPQATLTMTRELLAEINELTSGLGSVMGRIAKGILKVLSFAESMCEKVFGAIKMFMDDIPDDLFGGAEDQSDGMTDLREIGDDSNKGSGVLLQTILFVAEEAFTMALKFVEGILDEKKDMICGMVNSKIKLFHKIRDFACGVYNNVPAPNNTLIDELNASMKGFSTDISLINSCANNQATDAKLRAALSKSVAKIHEHADCDAIKKDLIGNIAVQAVLKIDVAIQENVDRHDSKLLSGLTNQLRINARRCKDSDVEFTLTRLELTCAVAEGDDLDALTDTIITEMTGKCTEIVEGKKALNECFEAKKAYAKKKYNALKTGAKKLFEKRTTENPTTTEASK